MRSRWGFGAAVAIMMIAYYSVPDEAWQFWLQNGVCYLAALAIPVALRRRGPSRREQVPWWLFAAAVALSSSGGIALRYGFGELAGPDVSDYLYLSFYPLCALALGIMMKQLGRRADWAASIDALTVTAGIGLLAWIYELEPALHAPGDSLADRITTIAYPLADMLLLALTLFLVRTNGPRGGSAPRWIAAAFVSYLIGDAAWVAVQQLNEQWSGMWLTDHIILSCYLIGLTLLALASWQPSIRDDGPGAAATARLTRPQLVLLSTAVLIAPAVLLGEALHSQVTHGSSIAIGSALMYSLVMTRMMQLLRQAERTSAQVRELSRQDALTGLPNRRASIDELPRYLEQARRDGIPISVGMLDLDHFKAYNDQYGHPSGDRLLKAAASAWHATLRRSDVLARYGGEEFIVLLPGADLQQATYALHRLQPVTPEDQTFSAGIATWDYHETSDELIARADAALYTAKRTGRDRVCLA
ncbi:diguanylate cyclase [Actinoplanes sp. TFC3]|uniref:GGDEF domain-containing protein n=1 Tax=Actinoplanes sp. TFC3 TaxID=1710355 RepID=UPI000AE762C8|nr:GGDEF domain-containing protein [Actinoplanes sp. TFC3]